MFGNVARIVRLLIPLLALWPSVLAANAARERPQLVLFIVVDQLRGDMPLRFQERFGNGGFRYLLDRGVVYKEAFYRHSTTFTAVGHATLITGSDPIHHGIAGNEWYDTAARQSVYCVEDADHHVLGREVIPHEGTSPRNLTAQTLGDQLVATSQDRSRVFAVSLKDRGAIILGGQRGKAFWFDKTSGCFVTSSYYYEDYPNWVAQWNAQQPADRFRTRNWDLLNDRSTYLFANRDDQPFERSYKLLGRTFPHSLDNPKTADYYSTLRFTPMADELTADFALELLSQERLGQGDATDMLCVGLSATDYIGHAFGPDSLEAEDNLLRVDRTLSRLLQAVDKAIGLDRTLVVLSSDHGVNAIPEYTESLGRTAGRLNLTQLQAHLNEFLQARYKTNRKLITAFANPSYYLDASVLEELGLDVAEVERAVAAEILAQPGFAYAVTRTDLLAGKATDDPILAKVQRAFHPQRSGNVLVVQSASWYLYSDPDEYAATHGSPYPYDTHVPIMIAGPGISPCVTERAVGPQDVASTVAMLLMIAAPPGNDGEPLREALESD